MAKEKKLPGALDGVDLTTLPPGLHSDQPGKGFYIDVQRSGSASWIYKYKFDGATVIWTYGSIRQLPDIQAARRWHAQQFAIRAAGRCPKTEYLRTHADEARATKAGISVKQAAKAWVEIKLESGWWRATSRSASNVERSLENHVYPKIGDIAMVALTSEDVMGVLRPIWHGKATLGEQVRQRLYAIFRHWLAKNADIRRAWEGLNFADIAHVEAMLEEKRPHTVKHHPSMPYQRVPAFMERLREREATGARALEMTILSALRVNSVVEGKWSELANWKISKAWTIPAERMKNGKPYTLPLTPRMMEILTEMEQRREDGNPHIFPGNNVGASLVDQTVLQFLQEGMREDCTVHGFRSSFRNWAFEAGRASDGLRFMREIPELCLTHRIGDSTELSYLTAEGRDLKLECLSAWSDYCASPPAEAPTNVVPMKRRAS